MEEKAKEIAQLLKVLANENRLLIFCALKKRPMHVGEIATFVPNITLSALSQHLAILRAHGLLDFKKSGQNITYFISDQRADALFDVLKEYYCPDDRNI